ncbi:hypothetical protein BH20GEM2_BH20GEM2_15620 [soil metagenome]
MTASAAALRSVGALLLLSFVGGCFGRPSGGPAPAPLEEQVRMALGVKEPSAEFFREVERLEEMGPAVDAVLYRLALDRDVDPVIRGNALTLLAERGAPYALGVLRRTLLTAEDEGVRVGAVGGLQRLAATSPAAARALRGALGDPSPRVRSSVLRGLDVEDVGVIRALEAAEDDRQIRRIARQLIALAEARGAPLVADSAGDLRTTTQEEAAGIVFQPTRRDTVTALQVGALWVETPPGRLRPITQRVEVVDDVVPAFLSPDSASLVYESERHVWVRDLNSGATRDLGPGVAPRLVPFTDSFVFLRERPRERREVPGGTELVYEVVRGRFGAADLESLGMLRATARPDRFGNASPVRWMVVGEVPEGFALRGEGVSTFALPQPFVTPRNARANPP